MKWIRKYVKFHVAKHDEVTLSGYTSPSTPTCIEGEVYPLSQVLRTLFVFSVAFRDRVELNHTVLSRISAELKFCLKKWPFGRVSWPKVILSLSLFQFHLHGSYFRTWEKNSSELFFSSSVDRILWNVCLTHYSGLTVSTYGNYHHPRREVSSESGIQG